MLRSDEKSGDGVGIHVALVKLKGPTYLLWAKAMKM